MTTDRETKQFSPVGYLSAATKGFRFLKASNSTWYIRVQKLEIWLVRLTYLEVPGQIFYGALQKSIRFSGKN